MAPSCLDRLADGVIRGTLVGLAWGAVFKSTPGEALALTVEAEVVTAESGVAAKTSVRRAAESLSLRESSGALARTMCRSSLVFASFLGVFSCTSCVMENIRGRRHWSNVFVGGTVAGLLLGARSGSPHLTGTTALFTGLLTAGVFAFDDNGDGGHFG